MQDRRDVVDKKDKDEEGGRKKEKEGDVWWSDQWKKEVALQAVDVINDDAFKMRTWSTKVC